MISERQLALLKGADLKAFLEKAIENEEALCEKAEIKLVKLGDPSLLEAYTAGVQLSHKAVLALIRLGDPAMMRACLSSNLEFSKEEQIKLVESGQTEAIVEYCGERSLCDKAEMLLVEKAQSCVVEYYFERWGLSLEALHMARVRDLL